jgi:hypothetical protein
VVAIACKSELSLLQPLKPIRFQYRARRSHALPHTDPNIVLPHVQGGLGMKTGTVVQSHDDQTINFLPRLSELLVDLNKSKSSASFQAFSAPDCHAKVKTAQMPHLARELHRGIIPGLIIVFMYTVLNPRIRIAVYSATDCHWSVACQSCSRVEK